MSQNLTSQDLTSQDLNSEQKLFGSIRHHMLIAGVTIFVLIGGLGLWTSMAKVSGAVVATGMVVVETNTKQVQHQEGGIVKDIKVKDGDLVEAGDLLIMLDDTLVRNEWESLIKQLYELESQHLRLLAEQKNVETIDFPQHDEDDLFL